MARTDSADDRSAVVGVFDDRGQAERAVQELRRAGFEDDQIGFASRGEEGTARSGFGTGAETEAGSHAATGAVAGGVLGALAGAAAALLIPGIGPVVAGGILATALGGAAVGAAAGGLIGALTGMGVPEDEARYYEQEVQAGRTIVTVKADGRSQDAQRILQQYGARDYSAAGAQGGQRRATEGAVDERSLGEGQETVQLREERLQPRKETVQTGEVGIRKEVVEEERTVEVPRTREEVYVERRPVEPRPADRQIGAEGETIRVPVREEQVQVEKQPVVREEVTVGKQAVQETEQVSGTVRREEARIEHTGDVEVRGDASSTTPRPSRNP